MRTPDERWQRVKELFEQALEQPAGARPGFLNAACAGDPRLLREVESLLAEHDRAESFLERPAVGAVAEELAGGAGDLAAGAHLGHFRIVSPLGRGGMGEVYLAEDSRLGRKVALKLLPAAFTGDADRLRRFEREACSASALNHPNILTVHEIGTEDGAHFIATEYVDGETLRERMASSPLTPDEALDIAAQVASALSAAHEAGIVHRDVKPENVMLRRDGIVKVLDFGLAKLTEQGKRSSDEEAPTRPLVRTNPGVVMGTVAYMSPEQTRGSATIDQRADIWSLGVVLYEMLAGRGPFEGADVHRQIIAIQEREPPPLAKAAEGVPEKLEEIVGKTLAKDPEERYQTAKDLLVDLRRLRKQIEVRKEIERTAAPNKGEDGNVTQSLAARPTSSAEYIFSRIKQGRRAFAVATLVVTLAAIGLVYWFFTRPSINTSSIESIAVLPFENRSGDPDTEYLSDGLTESLMYRLSQLPNLKVSPTSSVFRYKGKETDPIKAGNELGVSAVLSGRIKQRGEQLTISAELVDVRNGKLLWGEQYDRRMSDLLQTQREIAREIADKLKLKVSGQERGLAKHYTESNEAYQLYMKGRFYFNKRNEEGMQKSLEYFQQAIERDPNFALAYAGLADTYDLLGSPEAGGGLRPNDSMPKAKAAALRASEIDESLAEPHVSLAHVKYYYDRDWAGAEREFKRAIELNPNYPLAHHWYALYLVAAGRSDEGLAEVRRAQELDPLSLPINMTLGWLLCDSNRPDEGIEQLRKTIEMDPAFVVAHHRLGLCYERKGMYDDAVAEFQKIASLGGRVLALADLGQAYGVTGDRDGARKALAELQELSKDRYVSRGAIASIYAALGDKDQALAWLEKSFEEHDLVMARLKRDQRFDPLRSDPRFQDLLRRVGLTP